MNIVIPSYKRAANLKGYDYFRTAQYIIPESQRDDYLKYADMKRLITIPDEHDGNIARKRNWILKNIDRPLLMIDDDVRYLVTTEGRYDEEGRFTGQINLRMKLTPDQAERVILTGFNLAYEWGCVLWGIGVNTDGMIYKQFRPFSLSNVVLGPFMGHLEHDLFYDEAMGTKDDYDFSLQALNRYRKILRINKYAYCCSHGENKGGIVSMRTMKKEIDYCRAIERKWGRHIISYPKEPKRMADLLNGKVNVPIAGV